MFSFAAEAGSLLDSNAFTFYRDRNNRNRAGY
jgi:hypothetical protein